MFNGISLTQGELWLHQKVKNCVGQCSNHTLLTTEHECLGACVCLPELGLESLSRWTVPLGSSVGGESRSEGASQDRVDQRELLPLPDEEWTIPSPELLTESSGLL